MEVVEDLWTVAGSLNSIPAQIVRRARFPFEVDTAMLTSLSFVRECSIFQACCFPTSLYTYEQVLAKQPAESSDWQQTSCDDLG